MKIQVLTSSALMISSVFLGTAAQAQNIANTGWYVGGQLSQMDLELQ